MATPVYPPTPGPLPQPMTAATAPQPLPQPTVPATFAPPDFPQPTVPATFAPQPPVPHPATDHPAPVPQLADQNNAAPKIPEGGYAQRIVRIPLPQFALPSVPEPWIEMRNPGLMASATLEQLGQGLQGVMVGEDGEATEADAELIVETVIGLIRRWHIWDATDESDTPPLLPENVDMATLKRAPMGVIKAIGEAFMELQNPQ